MFASGQREPLFPFPGLPETAKAGFSIKELTLRPFGLYESDLDIDFIRTPRPFLVTEILECCTRNDRREKVPQNFFWNLTVGKRIECLLNLISSGEQTKIAVTLACPNGTCGQELEIDLSLDEISAVQAQAYADEHVSMKVGNWQFALRRPTAADQLIWLRGRFANDATVVQAMIRTLLLDEQDGSSASETETAVEAQAPAIEQSLDEHDPLIDFKVEIHCPYCETARLFELDLEELSLRRLRQAQLRLLASVHSLAAHYHWSEQQIFSVPYWRRAYYLMLIDGEKNQ
jgi:hypothetical protein